MSKKVYKHKVHIGPDHKLSLDLPEDVSNTDAEITVTIKQRSDGERSPVRKLSDRLEGKWQVPDSFFDPLTEEELKEWGIE